MPPDVIAIETPDITSEAKQSSFDLTAYTYAIFGYSYPPLVYTPDELAALIHAPISTPIAAAAVTAPEPTDNMKVATAAP